MDLPSATHSLMRVDDMSISVGALSTTVLPDETLKTSGSLVFLTFKPIFKRNASRSRGRNPARSVRHGIHIGGPGAAAEPFCHHDARTHREKTKRLI